MIANDYSTDREILKGRSYYILRTSEGGEFVSVNDREYYPAHLFRPLEGGIPEMPLPAPAVVLWFVLGGLLIFATIVAAASYEERGAIGCALLGGLITAVWSLQTRYLVRRGLLV